MKINDIKQCPLLFCKTFFPDTCERLIKSAQLSAEPSPRRIHQEQRVWLSPKLWRLYNVLDRILEGRPGCTLHLTKFGVDICVDKRDWSQEKRATLFLVLGDFRAQAARECISTSTLLVDTNPERL